VDVVFPNTTFESEGNQKAGDRPVGARTGGIPRVA